MRLACPVGGRKPELQARLNSHFAAKEKEEAVKEEDREIEELKSENRKEQEEASRKDIELEERLRAQEARPTRDQCRPDPPVSTARCTSAGRSVLKLRLRSAVAVVAKCVLCERSAVQCPGMMVLVGG